MYIASNPPVINTVTAISSSAVRVNWTRPTRPNGIITTYTISYDTNSNSGSRSVPYNGEEVSKTTLCSCMYYYYNTDTIL